MLVPEPNMAVAPRYSYMAEYGGMMNTFIHQPGATEFLRGKFKRAGDEMWALVRLLMAPDIDRHAAQSSFELIVRAGFRLALSMYISTVEWRLDFPAAGSQWNPQTQVYRDEWTPLVPGVPRSTNSRVHLAITPVIVRRSHNTQTLLVSTVRPADVFLCR